MAEAKHKISPCKQEKECNLQTSLEQSDNTRNLEDGTWIKSCQQLRPFIFGDGSLWLNHSKYSQSVKQTAFQELKRKQIWMSN